MKHVKRSHQAGARRASRWWAFLCMVCTVALASHAFAQAPAAQGGAAPPLSSDTLAKLVGPIALYPDDLVGIILPASTFPVQIVQADRFLDKRKADPKLAVDEKWDDSVKSLINYPDVVNKMSDDLDWTTALGEAVVTDQGAVIEAVQTFRRKAQAAGNLKSDGKQVVKVEQEIVYIQPADPQVIYVPQYNPTVVVVPSPTPVYAYYPTPYPVYYYPYPPGAALARGVVWGAALGAAWGGGRYGCCDDVNINVDRNTNIDRNTNRSSSTTRQTGSGSTAWKSNKQPGQVSGSVGRSSATTRTGDAPGAAGGAGRASPQATGAGAARGGGAGGDAFGGYGSGRQAQMDSSRGASSRSGVSSSSASARPTSSGGAARATPSSGASRGGGGGGGGRGGGGRR